MAGLPLPRTANLLDRDFFSGCGGPVNAVEHFLHGQQPTRLLRPWDSPGRVLEWGAIVFSAGPPGTITNSWSLLKLISIELVIPSNYLILYARQKARDTRVSRRPPTETSRVLLQRVSRP